MSDKQHKNRPRKIEGSNFQDFLDEDGTQSNTRLVDQLGVTQAASSTDFMP